MLWQTCLSRYEFLHSVARSWWTRWTYTFISLLLQLQLHTFISLLLQLQELRWSWQEMHNMMWWKCMHGFTISMLLSIVYCHASNSAAVEYAADCPPPPFFSFFSLPPPPPPPRPHHYHLNSTSNFPTRPPLPRQTLTTAREASENTEQSDHSCPVCVFCVRSDNNCYWTANDFMLLSWCLLDTTETKTVWPVATQLYPPPNISDTRTQARRHAYTNTL